MQQKGERCCFTWIEYLCNLNLSLLHQLSDIVKEVGGGGLSCSSKRERKRERETSSDSQWPRISLDGVPGHGGVEGNERADKSCQKKQLIGERQYEKQKWTSLTHIKSQKRAFGTNKKKPPTRNGRPAGGGFYIPYLKSPDPSAPLGQG